MPTRRKINLLETTTEKIGRMLSDNYGIKVVYAGDLCLTDGKTIYLPVVGEDAPDDLVEAFPGLIDHETSHVMDSDFAIVKALAKDPDGAKLAPILNLVEDARCERFIVKRWRGTKVNLAKTAEWGFRRLFNDWEKISEWGRFIQIMGAMAGQEDDHWALQKMQKLEPVLWPYATNVEHLLRKSPNLANTAEALELAREILEHVHQQTDSPPPQQKGENDDEGEGTPEETAGDGEGQRRDDQEEEGTEGSQVRPQGSSESDENEEDHPVSLKREWKPNQHEQEEDQQLSSRQEQIKAAAKATKQTHNQQYLVYTTEGDVIHTAPDGDRMAVQKLLDEHRGVTHVVEKKLMGNLTAIAKCRWECNQDRGRINPRALHRIVTGTSTKVFRKRVEALKFDTRCSLWIDHSYSMNGSPLRTAAASALIFGEVLNRLGIPFEVCGYSTMDQHIGEQRYRAASKEDRKVYTRWGNLWVRVYKGFNEDWSSVKHRCSNMARSAQSNTFDGEVVKLAARRLLMHPERRRILFVFNDGEPCPNVQQFLEVHTQYLKDVAAEVEKHIELFAIGISSSTVGQFYSNAVCINNVSDLPKVMMGKLDQLLRKMQRQLMQVA